MPGWYLVDLSVSIAFSRGRYFQYRQYLLCRLVLVFSINFHDLHMVIFGILYIFAASVVLNCWKVVCTMVNNSLDIITEITQIGSSPLTNKKHPYTHAIAYIDICHKIYKNYSLQLQKVQLLSIVLQLHISK